MFSKPLSQTQSHSQRLRSFWLVPRNQDFWEKSEGELVLATAVTLSTHVQKPLVNVNACTQSHRNQDFLDHRFFISSRGSRIRSPLTENVQALGTRLSQPRQNICNDPFNQQWLLKSFIKRGDCKYKQKRPESFIEV